MRPLSLYLLGSVAATAQAVAFPGPQPTNGQKEVGVGWNPKPTDGPILDNAHDLRIRAIDAYPRTCGWVGGDLSATLIYHITTLCLANSNKVAH